jgi:AraC-like DNA-binding protein
MDKNTIYDAKNFKGEPKVHCRPELVSEVLHDYGLWVFSVKRDSLSPPKNSLSPRQFEFYGFSQLLEGRGWYWNRQEGIKLFSAGAGVISTPGFVQDYGGDDSSYREDALCFYGPLADALYKRGLISDGIVHLGQERKLLKIIELAQEPSEVSQIRAGVGLQNLLVSLYLEKRQIQANGSDSHLERLDILLRRIQNDPGRWWTLPEMAEFCALSQNQFRRVFQKYTGLSPKTYLDRVKIQKASEILCSSELPVRILASKLGYSDPYHFSRRFKELTGLAPEYYRREYSLKEFE